MPIGRGGGGSAPPAVDPGLFPLRLSQRHILSARGTPFFLLGDTAWAIVAQLTNAEITSYLNARAAQGFNLVLFSAPEAYYTSRTPSYNNVDGVAPFSPMSPVNFANPVEAYWTRVDHLVNTAKALGMVCLFNPCYHGSSDADGWRDEMTAESDADLQTYGQFLANRYTQGNIIWCGLGDDDDATRATKNWNIFTGIRSVRTTDIITAHPLSDGSNSDDAYTYVNAKPGFSLNWIYGWATRAEYVYALAQQAYGRNMPFAGAEFQYEGESSIADGAQRLRIQTYGAILSGACIAIYGNSPVWHFDSSRAPFSDSTTWSAAMSSAGAQHQTYARQLFDAYAWWKLEPKTDASLVTGSLSSAETYIYPALAGDGTFAMIYVPSSQTITVNTNALTGVSGNVRIRRWNVTAGDWTTINAGVAKTSAQSVATGAEGVIVIEAV